jgi:hypothetical protein
VVVGAEHHIQVLLLRLRFLLTVDVVTQDVHHVRLYHHYLVVDLSLVVVLVRQTIVVLYIYRLLRV